MAYSEVLDGGNALHTWRMAVDILKNQSLTADMG
jgi:hypothetical protein